MKKAEVKFENITKKFNETVAVDNVSCTFEAGTLTTLLGPSGCGKTTSLRIIAGLERATDGKISIDNEDVTILPATDRDCLLYTSPSPRDGLLSRMPSSA